MESHNFQGSEAFGIPSDQHPFLDFEHRLVLYSKPKYMLQDSLTIRYYQRLTDGMVEKWRRGQRYEDIRNYVDGYIACLHHTSVLEPYQIHRLEEDIYRFLRDPSNFELDYPQTQTEADYSDYY